MFKSLALKEYLKLRKLYPLLLLFNAAMLVYLFVSLRSIFEFNGVVKVWNAILHDKFLIYEKMKYTFFASAALIAFAQFIPETSRKRLKLLFHLPVNHYTSVYFMQGLGLASYLLIGIMNLAGITLIMSMYFPAEAAGSAFYSVLPWFFAGLFAYLALALTLVETNWLRRLVYIAASYYYVQIFYQGDIYLAYEHSLPAIVCMGLLYVPAIILPLHRFKRGLK